jgi:ADP-ribose pyrophosphatase YjhB (NUDIX family)
MKARRKYPTRPIVGAGAVVHRGPRVLLVKRRYPPNRGKWALPGGIVELGEKTEEAAVREVLEETGLTVVIESLFDVQTDVQRDADSRPEYHFVLVDYLARPSGGKLNPNRESTAAGWFSARQAKLMNTTDGTRIVLDNYFGHRLR